MKKRKDSFFGLHFDLHPKRNDTNLGADLDEENIRTLSGSDPITSPTTARAMRDFVATKAMWASHLPLFNRIVSLFGGR